MIQNQHAIALIYHLKYVVAIQFSYNEEDNVINDFSDHENCW